MLFNSDRNSTLISIQDRYLSHGRTETRKTANNSWSCPHCKEEETIHKSKVVSLVLPGSSGSKLPGATVKSGKIHNSWYRDYIHFESKSGFRYALTVMCRGLLSQKGIEFLKPREFSKTTSLVARFPESCFLDTRRVHWYPFMIFENS